MKKSDFFVCCCLPSLRHFLPDPPKAASKTHQPLPLKLRHRQNNLSLLRSKASHNDDKPSNIPCGTRNVTSLLLARVFFETTTMISYSCQYTLLLVHLVWNSSAMHKAAYQVSIGIYFSENGTAYLNLLFRPKKCRTSDIPHCIYSMRG